MVKDMFYSQVRGRRATDQPGEAKFKFDWWKLIIVPLIGWATWLTIHGFLAERNAEKINVQTEVLHNRITGLDHRFVQNDQKIRQWILDKIIELQKEIYNGNKVGFVVTDEPYVIDSNQRQQESR